MIIDIHGLVIDCQAESSDLLSSLIRPFKYYVKDKGLPTINVIIEEKDPSYESFPSIKASFSTPRNIVYSNKSYKIIDYFGKGVIKEDSNKSVYTVFSRDRNFLQEAFYLLVLSLFGEFCDKNGLLRIHALALSYKDSAIILTLPPGGGKSTMAIELLKNDGFKLISDDEAIIDKHGYIYPFPLRIGTLDKSLLESIPSNFVYKINRMEFGVKYFIDSEYWKEKLEHRRLKKNILFLSQRLINGEPSIEEVSKRRVLSSLLTNAVVGIGLYQGLEFILYNSTWEVLSRIPVLFRRLNIGFRFSLTTKAYQINLSRDISKNVHVFKEALRNLS